MGVLDDLAAIRRGEIPQGRHRPRPGAFLHGEFVTSGDQTGPQTLVMQVGLVTAYTAGAAIAVESQDGFAQSYLITETTLASAREIALGETVRLVAERDTLRVQLLMLCRP